MRRRSSLRSNRALDEPRVRLPSETKRKGIKNSPAGISYSFVVIPKGVEPLIFWMRTRRPGPLDDGTTYAFKFNRKRTICKAWALPPEKAGLK